MATPHQQQQNVRRAKTKDELKDPAQIGATGTASKTFQILPQYESLDAYMTLPVEQYFVLDPKQISHLGGNRFELTVPRINIFNLWIEAFVEVSVNSFPDASSEAAFASSPSSSGSPLPLPLGPGSGPRVLLRAENCRITGSDAVESLRLDQRFAMRFVTELTWRSTAPTTSNGNGNGNGHAGSGSGGAVQQQQQQAQGEIRADSRLDVWSEVVQPFHLLPREVLVATCNGVLRGLMGSLLPLFVRMLAQDYQRWAVDAAYRAERAQRSAKPGGGNGSA